MSVLVVGYDGTDGARAALDEAVRLATDLDATIHLVFAYEAPRIGGELRDLDEAIEERANKILEHGVHHAVARGANATTTYMRLDTASALVEVADELDARYIVVGSNGERSLKSTIVGSTPTKLLYLSERPVLVVRVPG